MVALVVSGSDLPLRGGNLSLRGSVTPIGHCSGAPVGAVSRFGGMSPVTVRVTTLVFVPVKFDRDVKLVH